MLNLRSKLILCRSTKNIKSKYSIKEILENHYRFLNAKTLIFQTYLNDISSDLNDFFHFSKLSLMNLSFIKKEDEKAFSVLKINENNKALIIPLLKIIYLLFSFNFEGVDKEENSIQMLYVLSQKTYGKSSLKEVIIEDVMKKLNYLSHSEIEEMQINISKIYNKCDYIFSSYLYVPISMFCSKIITFLKYFYDLLNDYLEKEKMVRAIETKIGTFVECSETLKKEKDSIADKLNKNK
ncbi:MAG: hypothetical protein MJ252_20495 [archaeon]|nr:hypothetical protein [archaeon]